LQAEFEGMLFDMDGVLVSSIGSVTRCWRRWAAHYGVPNADTYEVPHGVRAIDIMQQLVPGVDTVEGLRFIEDMEIEDVADLKVLPGAGELLRSLPAARWAIVTSATRRLLIGRLEAAGLPVPDLIISGDMVERGKPDPEPYRRGAALIHAAPSACLVVEDAPSGVRAGVAAGCTVLGVEGTHAPEELLAAGARWVVPSLAQVRLQSADRLLTLSF
jgi:mannitol-1-/sugar-/sorbitol-6-phosphatase